jgi:alpha-amylase/alpha-mannosidase (GH57 family)
MSASRRLDFVLVWHLHQPDYRDHASGEFMLPWVYLHAIKDYTDMAWHLEQHPGMRAVVNWVPVLLDQMEDYAEQFDSGKLRDPLLRLLARDEAHPLSGAERALLAERCLDANAAAMMRHYPPYQRLYELFRQFEAQGQAAPAYLSDRFFYDALTWYHLAWTGETVRRESELVTRLMAVGEHFTCEQRRALFQLIGEIVRGVVGRYARLAAAGRIELSTTPHAHPLAPLLLDFACAREAEPNAQLPGSSHYPGGRARVEAHLEAALASHARRFGAAARGLWPAEGAVSEGLLRLLVGKSLTWAASGERVLANSLAAAGRGAEPRSHYLYRPYRLETAPDLLLFFRDDDLSDRIGFEYRHWHGSDAAANFIGELERIAAQAPQQERPLVSVILDGENAWEHYPYNAYYFLHELYRALESHAYIRPTTYAAFLRGSPGGADAGAPPAAARKLERLVAGSWVFGNFSTWIGSADKNRAWDLLCAAKQSYDLVRASGRLDAGRSAAAARQLADCEGSDWFWWFGDYNSSAAVASFDRLYRAKLAYLYRLIGLPAPAALAEPISHGHGAPEGGGSMRRGSATG